MRCNSYFFPLMPAISLTLLSAVVIAQDAPTGFKGVVLKGRAPISNEIIRVKFAKPVESKLKNGIDLMVLEDHRSPTIQVEIAMPGSSLNYPADLAGISEATSAMLRMGTKSRSALQIAEALADLGANIGASADEHYFVFRFTTLTENLDAVFDLASDILFNPTFPESELDKWKSQQLSSLQQIRTQPAFLAQERFTAVLYPGDNRSIVAPSPDSIRKITRDLVVEHYNKNFRPEGAKVAVVGDVTPQQISARLEKMFADWKGSGQKRPVLTMHGPIAEKKIYLIHRPNSVQTTLSVGNHAIDRLSPDYIPLMVLNGVLGSGPASRLFRNIREEKGYTYSIISVFSTSHYLNHYAASTNVRTEVTGPTLEELLKEFRDIRDRLVPADELEGAKRALMAAFALNTESPATTLRNATTIKEYGLPADYWDTYPEKIAAVTAQEVQRVARKYIPVDNIQIVAVGDATKIRDVLSKFGPVEEWDSEGRRVK